MLDRTRHTPAYLIAFSLELRRETVRKTIDLMLVVRALTLDDIVSVLSLSQSASFMYPFITKFKFV